MHFLQEFLFPFINRDEMAAFGFDKNLIVNRFAIFPFAEQKKIRLKCSAIRIENFELAFVTDQINIGELLF